MKCNFCGEKVHKTFLRSIDCYNCHWSEEKEFDKLLSITSFLSEKFGTKYHGLEYVGDGYNFFIEEEDIFHINSERLEIKELIELYNLIMKNYCFG